MKTGHMYFFTDSEQHENQRCHRPPAETAPSDLTHDTQSEHFSTIHPARHATRRMSDHSDQQRRPRTRCKNPCRTSQSTTPTNCQVCQRNPANSAVFHRTGGFDGHNYHFFKVELGDRLYLSSFRSLKKRSAASKSTRSPLLILLCHAVPIAPSKALPPLRHARDLISMPP